MFKVELAFTLRVKLLVALNVELLYFEEECHFFSKICLMSFILHA
jgi:hypothetical protein